MKTDFSFKLIHSRRKTIALIVDRDGQLTVRAPFHAAYAQILAFIERKADWIRAKQAIAQQRQTQPLEKQFVRGETFLYLGSLYPLEIVDRARTSLALKNGRFEITKIALPRAKETFIGWYKKQARQILEERALLYAEQYNLNYERIKITSARTRWGSCSTLGTLSFTWRLVLAPLPVIDYVVVHELAHLVEKNHSKRFWDRVGSMMGDYAKHVQWLKANGYRLNLE